MDNYLTQCEESFNIYIESEMDASCASIEYKLANLDLMETMINDARDRLLCEKKELEDEENGINTTPSSILRNKITQMNFSSNDAKNELLTMSELYKNYGYDFGKYGCYYKKDIPDGYKISSYEDLFEYNKNGFIINEKNLQKQLYETIKFKCITVGDFLQFMKFVVSDLE